MEPLPPLPPPDPPDVTQPVRRHLVSAGVVVIAAALVFLGLDLFVASDDGQPVASPTITDLDATPTETDPVALPSTSTSPTDVDAEPTAEPTPTPTPTATATAEPSPTPTPTPDPEPTATTDDGEIPRSSISVQVLDAVLDDGRATADKVAAELKADGYRVVATNSAIRTYEKTTVMYTAGFEAQARQIAEEYGFTEVQQQPGNLTDQVQVHLVVGLDAR